jgi:hypothetical protein
VGLGFSELAARSASVQSVNRRRRFLARSLTDVARNKCISSGA